MLISTQTSHRADGGEAEREWLQRLLLDEIPLARAMRMTVTRLDDTGIVLAAPLAPNRNDKGTAFGGSLLSLMVLAGWSMVRTLLERQRLDADVVIAACQARFIAPVTGELHIEAVWPTEPELQRFFDTLARRGRARLAITPAVRGAAGSSATLDATFAAAMRSPA